MSKKLYLMFIFFSLTVSAVSHAKIYRWVDDNGKVHYTDTPPASAKAEEHKIYINSTAFKQAPNKTEKEESKTSDELAGSELELLPEPDPQKCQEFKSSAQKLRDRPRARVKGEDGEYRFLEPSEINERISDYDNAANIYCG